MSTRSGIALMEFKEDELIREIYFYDECFDQAIPVNVYLDIFLQGEHENFNKGK